MRSFVVMLSCLILLSACSSVPNEVVSTGDRYVPQDAGVEDYRLGAGDKLKVSVFNEPTLSGEFSVGTDGMLSLPLVGDLRVLGDSATIVASKYQSALANGYLRDPKVSAEIISFRPFFILGEVKTPGQFPYASGMTALNAIALAQGFSPRAERSVVFIRRAGAADEVAFRLSPDLRVWPGDTIRIGEKYF
jgi:polysaccharide export outer membrane protein